MADNGPIVVTYDSDKTLTLDPVQLVGNKALYRDNSVAYIPGRTSYQLSHRTGKVVREVRQVLRFPRLVENEGVPNSPDFGGVTIVTLIPIEWTPAQTASMRMQVAALQGGSILTGIHDNDVWVY